MKASKTIKHRVWTILGSVTLPRFIPGKFRDTAEFQNTIIRDNLGQFLRFRSKPWALVTDAGKLAGNWLSNHQILIYISTHSFFSRAIRLMSTSILSSTSS